jgi:hypothetical protein
MKVIRPIVSLILAGLVLLASIGVNVNLHMCGGKVKSSAVFGKAAGCPPSTMSCHRTSHSTENGCCQEKNIVLKGKVSSAEVRTSLELTPSHYLVAVILPVLYFIHGGNSSAAPAQFANYKPPLLQRDISVLVQSFLI